jgi:hypothetical protein
VQAIWARLMQGDDQAICTALRLSERRSKLLGLDAPVRAEWAGPEGEALQFVIGRDRMGRRRHHSIHRWAMGKLP